ncbi:Hsp33 family molecular chaperone HslO [Piscinibacter sp. Jin2]|uniref:Hsp33 family molecular chaperone HslO n=1 Tax=Aquariibacter lacus TaxID=2801332 RepID=A0A9X0XEE0_9BURK|nr:Hsp33 family molecular chaperone HslO [Piscinibacter lacus]MBL0720006.1 Hsp33 family molecular chaperone HslO [Piscinibacter lacus]
MSELHKFIFEGLPVRGMLVRLTEGWQALQAVRASAGGWPAPLTGLVGELAAAGVLMQANLKFNGALVVQIHGDGPVKLAVVEVQPELKFRATATLNGELPPDAGLPAMVNARGKGRCAITLDPADRLPGQQPYQGVVPLHGDRGEPLHRLSEVLEHYMLQSEQLDTKLILAANGELAAGLLIQRLPVQGEGNLERAAREDEIGLSEAYTRIAHLASTLTPEELLTLDAETVLRRLFWEEDLRRFEPLVGEQAPRFACRCSRERVGAMLRSLGREEMDDLIAERGEAEVGCEFCGAAYRFDAVDVGELFVPVRDQPPVSGRPQ